MTNLIFLFSFMLGIGMTVNQNTPKKKKGRTLQIESKVTINAEANEIYSLLKSMDRFPEWSPFLVTDPQQKNHTSGTDGEIGSAFHWVSVAEKGKGTQTLTQLKSDEYLRMECDITEPFVSQPSFEYYIQANGDGQTEVKQVFTMQSGGFSLFMMKLFGATKQIAETNQLGLDRLKNVLEN